MHVCKEERMPLVPNPRHQLEETKKTNLNGNERCLPSPTPSKLGT